MTETIKEVRGVRFIHPKEQVFRPLVCEDCGESQAFSILVQVEGENIEGFRTLCECGKRGVLSTQVIPQVTREVVQFVEPGEYRAPGTPPKHKPLGPLVDERGKPLEEEG